MCARGWHTSHAHRRVSFSPHLHQDLFVVFWIIVILTGVRWCLIVILICISLVTNDEHLSLFLLAMCLSSLGKVSSHPPPIVWLGCLGLGFFFICLFVCFDVEFFEFFAYLGYWPLITYIFCKYVLPFSRQPFHFVDSFLCCAKAF